MAAKKLSFENTEIAFQHYSNSALKRALSVYKLIGNNLVSKLGSVAVKIAIAVHFPIKPFVKPLVFKQFCGGESLNESLSTIQLMQQRGVSTSLNYSVEIKKSEEDFDKTLSKNIGAVEFAGKNTSVKVICCKVSGMGYFSILQKVQEKEKLTKKEKASFKKMKERLNTLCELAASNGTKIYLDAEESWVQDVIDDLVEELMAKYNQEQVIVYNTFQMYRHDRLTYLKETLTNAKKEGYLVGAKIVRGAYMEKERDWAEDHGLPSPIQDTKEDTDRDFDAAVKYCLENIELVSICIASHNEGSSLLATKLMQERNIATNHQHVWFSQLYGMGEHITYNLAAHGFNTSKYLPYGPVKEVIPYLIRRADENTSVDGQMSRELTIIQKEIDRRN